MSGADVPAETIDCYVRVCRVKIAEHNRLCEPYRALDDPAIQEFVCEQEARAQIFRDFIAWAQRAAEREAAEKAREGCGR